MGFCANPHSIWARFACGALLAASVLAPASALGREGVLCHFDVRCQLNDCENLEGAQLRMIKTRTEDGNVINPVLAESRPVSGSPFKTGSNLFGVLSGSGLEKGGIGQFAEGPDMTSEEGAMIFEFPTSNWPTKSQFLKIVEAEGPSLAFLEVEKSGLGVKMVSVAAGTCDIEEL